MGKNVNRRFTVDLDISTENIEKKVKGTVGNLKTILADLGKASDKMGFFKELTDYLAQVDTQIAMFKQKHGDGLFNQIFGSLDENLRKETEKIFGVAKEQLTQLEQLKEKVAAVKTSGASSDDIKAIEQEVKAVYEAAGMLDKLDLSGRGKVETRIQKIEDALGNFAQVWQDTNSKISKGFNFGDAGGSGDTSEIDKQIDNVKKQLEELTKIKEEIRAVNKDFHKFTKETKFDGSVAPTIDSVKELISAYDEAIDKRKAFEKAGDNTSREYYENEIGIARLNLKASDWVENYVDKDPNLLKNLKGEKLNGKSLAVLLNKMYGEYNFTLQDVEEPIMPMIKNLKKELKKLEQQKNDLTKGTNADYSEQVKKTVQDIKDLQAEIDQKNKDGLFKDEDLSSYIRKIGELSAAFKSLSQSADMSEAEIKEIEGIIDTVSTQLSDRLEKSLKNKNKNPISVIYEDAALKVKRAVGEIAKLDKEYETALGTSAKINAFDKNSPSDLQREYIVEAFREYQKNKEAIKNMSMSDVTDKDITLLEKQLQLLKTINQASIDGAGIEDYKKVYGLDGEELKSFNSMLSKKTNQNSMNELLDKLKQGLKERRKSLIAELSKDNEEIAKLIEASGDVWNQFLASEGKNLPQPNSVSTALNRELEQKAAKNVAEQKRFNDLKSQFDASIKDFTDTGLVDIIGAEQKAYNDVLDGIRNKTINTVEECKEAFAKIANLNYDELIQKNAELKNKKPTQQEPTTGDGDGGVAGQIEEDADSAKNKLAELKRVRDEYISIIDSLNKKKKAKLNITSKNDTEVLKSSLKEMQDTFTAWSTSKNGTEEQLEAYGKLIKAVKNYQSAVEFVGKSGSARAKNLLQTSDFSKATTDANGLLGILDVGQLKKIKKHFETTLGAVNKEIAEIAGDAAPKVTGAPNDKIEQTGNAAKETEIKIKSLTDAFNEYILTVRKAEDVEWNDNMKTSYAQILNSIKDNTFTTVEECVAKFKELTNITEVVKSKHATAFAGTGHENIGNAGQIVDNKSNYTSAEVGDLESMRAKLVEVRDAVNAKTDAFSDEYLVVDGLVEAEKAQLNELKQALTEVKNAIDTKTQTFEEEYVTVDAAVDAEIASLNKLKILLEEIQGILQVVFSVSGQKFGDIDISQDKTNVDAVSSAIQGIQQTLCQILGVLQGFTGIESDGKNSIKQKEPAVDNGVASSKVTEHLASKLSDLATEGTLAKIPGAIEQLANAITTKGKADDANNANITQSLNNLISALSANISSLKEVMDGVVVHQKAQKSDTKKAMSRIQDPAQFKQVSSIAENSIGGLGTDVHIKGLKALADGLVGVEGAFKNVNGEWEGFTVKVNESNDAVDLAINKQSAFAKVMQKLEEEMKKAGEDANDRKLSPDATANHAIVTANGYDDEGKEVTVQYKDSQRYTVSLKENIGGLQKEVFQTFDDSIEDFNERTTVTVSNKTAATIRETNKLIEENVQKVGNANLLQEYNVEYKKLLDMNDRYRNTSISDVDIETWNKQITLVQTLGNEVSGLIKQQQKLDNQAGVATSAKRLQEYQTNAGKIFNELDFGLTTAKTDEQKAIVDTYDKIIEKIDLLKKSHSVLTDSQIADIDQLVAALRTQSDAYLDAKKKENEKYPAEQLKQDKDYELDELQKYQNDVEKTAYATKELSDKIDGLKNKLGTIQSSDELDEWRKDLVGVKKEIETAKSTFELLNFGYINSAETKLKGSFNQLTGDQKLSLQAEYENAIATLEQYKTTVQQGNKIELDQINKVVNALHDRINAYKEANKEAARKQQNEQKKAADAPEKARIQDVKQNIKDAKKDLNKNFGTLDFNVDTKELSDKQKDIVEKYKELDGILKKYSIDASQVSKEELNNTLERVAALQKEIDVYKQKYNIKDAKGGTKTSTYGSTQVMNATAKHKSLVDDAKSLGLTDDSEAVKNYTNALQGLIQAQNAFRAGENLDSDAGKAKVQAFKDAQTACSKYARELNNVVTASKKLESEGMDIYPLVNGEFDLNNDTGRQSALNSYIAQLGESAVTVGNFTDGCNKLHYTIKNGDGTFTAMTATINKARTAIVATAGDTENATGKFASFFNELKGKFKSISTYFMASFGIEEVWQQLRQGVQYVRDIDSALTELKKVTNETDASYDAFLQSMSKTGSVIGATVQDLTTMAADWARLGYSMEEAGKLAESTAILLNVSEFQDATAASEALISTMQAFQYTADDSQHVVDILNEVGNNYAVSSDGIATALQDSASALMEAGNNLEQSVALVAAANKVVQDPNSVGSALRTISLRLRGTSVSVLEEMGEETDGVVESVSKMQEKIKALTGVDILTDSGAYKETYTILKEIGTVWEDMSDIDQAALLELMAGKNRANTLAAILGNMEDLEGAYNDALKAEGSALKENEAYLDSIQGRIDLFTNSLQTMWMNFIDSSVVKFIVDIGTALIKAADAMGVLSTAAGGFVGIKAIINSVKSDLQSLNDTGTFKGNFFEKFTKDADTTKVATEEVQKSLEKQSQAIEDNIDVTTDAVEASTKHGAAKAAEKAMVDSSTVATGIESGVKEVNTKKTWAQVAAEKALAVAKGLAKGLLIGAVVALATTALTSAISAISDASKRMDELTDSAIKSAEETKEAQESISDYKDEIADLRSELDSNTLSEAEAYDARQRLIEIQNELIDKFGLEAEGLNLVTGAINDQADALDKLSQKSASDWMKENMEAYKEAQNEMAKTYNSKKELLLFGQATSSVTGTSGTLDNASQDVISAYQEGLKRIIEDEYGGTLSEKISSSVDDLGNTISFDNIYASFEGKTVEELDKIFDVIQTYLLDFENNYDGIDLSDEIIRVQNLRNKYVDEDYKKSRELYDSGRQQEAIANYAKEYGAILDAEEEIYNAKNDEEKLNAIKEYRAALESAKNAKTDDAHMDDYFDEIGDKFEEQEFELKVKLDEDGLKSNLETIIKSGGENGLSILDDVAIQDMVNRGLNIEGATDSSGKYTQEQISSLIALQAEADKAGVEIGSLITILTRLGLIAGDPANKAVESIKATGQAYSALAASTEQYVSVNEVLNEAIYDNVKISEDQYNALKEVIGSEEEFADCIDTTNGYVVKNSALIRKLVNEKKKDQRATIQQAKSYSQLQYKTTVGQIQRLINKMVDEIKATGYVSNATLEAIDVYHQQLKVLKETIQQYALLELSLTDAASAYSEFESAKERDAQLTYGDSMVEMLEAINEGFKTGKTGSETFQAAVKALVPESVYKDIDDLSERLIAIHDYIDKDANFADYFTIDDGNFSIGYKNIVAFIEDCQKAGLFTGTDATNFEFNAKYVSDGAEQKVQELNGILKEYQEAYGGTVDLVNRKRIDVTEENIGTVHGWGSNMADVEVGDYMTVASQTYRDGNVAIAVTPILPNGELMEQDELDAYIDDVISKTNAGSGNYADYDTKGILMGIFDDAGTWEENLQASDDFVNSIHEIHEAINSIGESASLADFANELGITEAAALALLTELEKYDSSWGNIIADLTATPLDREINKATRSLEEAITAQEEFIKSGQPLYDENGTMTAGYKAVVDATNNARDSLNNATQAAIDNAQTYTQVEAILKGMSGEMKLTQDQADSLARSLGLIDENGHITINTETGAIELTNEQVDALNKKLTGLEEPTILDIQLAYDDIHGQVEELKTYLADPNNYDGTILADLQLTDASEAEVQAELDRLTSILGVLELHYNLSPSAEQDGNMEKLASWETNGINITITGDSSSFNAAVAEANAVEMEDKPVSITADPTEANTNIDSVDNNDIADKKPKIAMQGVSVALTNIESIDDALDALPTTKTVTVNVNYKQTGTPPGGGVGVNGNFHISGGTFAGGTVGAQINETALVGELGPELLVRNGRWTTVGDNGAEFTQIKKGDIIFNHKQTEELLSKGYVTGRGKAYASGNAYYGVVGPYVGDNDAFKNGSDKWMDPYTNASNSLSNAADDISDAADEFREVFDWIEVRLEEINERIDLKGAKLDNAVGHKKQNAIVDDMIDLNEKLYDNLIAGANKYYSYAKTLLAKVPAAYREAAQNGTIAIETFVGEVDEKTLEAIQDYREWVQKGADATQQAEEVITEISSLAKQAIDNISDDYGNKSSIRDSEIDQLDAYNKLTEAKYGSESANIYKEIIKETNNNIKTLQEQRNKMQSELNKQVQAGNIKKYSQDWYDAVNDIAAVDTEIINLTADTYDYQDSINELHWDAFDNLISRLEAVSDEASNVIDILGNKDLVDEDGNWTDEGITSLGLYAQQMENAEVQSKKYREEINYLNKNWESLGFTEQEYNEKLEELTSNQYDSIKAYHDAKDAIKDLTAERVDAIKNGIEKEIDAFEELIKTKKELLDSEKDAYDFQKSVSEQNKEISDIERQLAVLSASDPTTRAKRAQLQAELAKAKADLEETFYEKSIEDQQKALDKELESFQKEKDKELEGWDKYLEDTETVVADGLAVVQNNTEIVYQTLQDMGQEYSLLMSDALTSPWKDGESAIQSYAEKFGLAMSSTVKELQDMADECEKLMSDTENHGKQSVDKVNNNITNYQDATKEPDNTTAEAPKAVKVGGKINAGSAKIYEYAGDTSGEKQYYANDPIYKVLKIDGDWVQVRHHKQSTGVAGWFRKSQVKAYAKGSTGIKEDQWALIDELGEELSMHAGKDGKLSFMTKGSTVVPHDITENLMQLGQLNPQDVLDRNRPIVGAPHVTNNETVINIEYGDILHIDNFSGDKPADLSKMIDRAFEKHMKQLNAEIRKFTR